MIEAFSPQESIINLEGTREHDNKYSIYSEKQKKAIWDEVEKNKIAHNLFSFKKPNDMIGIKTEDIDKEIHGSMQQLVLNVTEKCNFRCTYCTFSGYYKYERTHSNNDMPENIALRSIRYYLENSTSLKTKFISFYGGEPLLKLKLIKRCVEFARENYLQDDERSIRFNLTTNGYLLNADEIEYLRNNRIGLLVSLDGPEHIHNKYRRRPNKQKSFHIVYNNLRKIWQLDEEYFMKHVGISAVTTPSDLEESIDFLSNDQVCQNVSHIVIGQINPHDNSLFNTAAYYKQAKYSASSWKRLLDKYVGLLARDPTGRVLPKAMRGLFDRLFLGFHKRQISKIDNTIPPNGICIPGSKRLFVSAGGQYYICEKMGENVNIGNVDDGIILAKVRKAIDDYISISKDDCLKCWLMRVCSACYCAAKEKKTMTKARKQIFCLGNRSFNLMILKYYCSLIYNYPETANYFNTYFHDVTKDHDHGIPIND